MSSESPSSVLLERQEGDLLWVTLNDPKRANALSPTLVSELTATFSRDLRSEGVRAVVLCAAGKHFSAGADLENLRNVAEADIERNREDSRKLRDLFEAILRQEALTIALVHGACVAGGCGLATACDFVIAADEARFMYSEVRIGFVAALVATYLTLRLRGSDIRELLLNPEFLTAGPALEIGLVNRIVPEVELRGAAEELAGEILSKASSESIGRTKRMLLEVLGRDLDERLDIAAEENAQSRLTEDCRIGVGTFLETKKSPNWRTRAR